MKYIRLAIFTSFALFAFVLGACSRSATVVVFHYNGGVDADGNSVKYAYVTDSSSLVSQVPDDVALEIDENIIEPTSWTLVMDDASTAVNFSSYSPKKGETVDLYAYYEGQPGKYITISFNTGNVGKTYATRIAPQRIRRGTRLRAIDTPTLEGYHFYSWSTYSKVQFASTEEEARSKQGLVDVFKAQFSDDQTLCAVWKKEERVILTYVVGQKSSSPFVTLTSDVAPRSQSVLKYAKLTRQHLPVLESTSKYLPFLGWSTRTYGGTINDSSSWKGFGDPAYIINVGDESPSQDTVLYAAFGPEMAIVKGGKVTAGQRWTVAKSLSDNDQIAKSDVTVPNHMMAKYEVTCGLWEEVVGRKAFTEKGVYSKDVVPPYASMTDARVLFNKPNEQRGGKAAIGGGADGPVSSITWAEAVIFCNELTRMLFGDTDQQAYNIAGQSSSLTWSDYRFETGNRYSYHSSGDWNPTAGAGNYQDGTQPGPYPTSGKRGFRLPKNEEWEWSYRGGNSLDGSNWNHIYAGSDNISEVAVWGGGIIGSTTEGSETTRAVGSLKPNSLGIYDMSGNVAEYLAERGYSGNDKGKMINRGSSFQDSHEMFIWSYVMPFYQCSTKVGFRLCRSY